MKKLCFLLILAFNQTIFCQNYHFDRMIHYIESSESGKQFVTIFVNTNNKSYFFINKSWNNQIDAYLVDNNLNLAHSFIEDKEQNQVYKYLYTRKFNPNNCNIDCSTSSMEETKNEGEFTKITYNQFVSKKKKRKNYTIEVIAKPVNFPCLTNLIQTLQHHFLFCEELKISENNIPTSAKFILGNRVSREQTLQSVSNVDVNLTVNKEDIIYTTN